MKKAEKTLPKKNISRDQNTIILEDLADQFRAFGEGMEVFSDGQKRLEEKVDRIDERLIRVEDDVVWIKHKLSEKVDRDEFQKLEKRLIKLEKMVLAGR